MKSRRFHLIIFVLLLMSIGIAVLFHSRAALQWAWQKVETLTHGVVTAQRVDGVLAGPITIEGLQIHLPTTDIAIRSAKADWHPGRLLTGRLSITEAAVSELVITLHPSGPNAPPSGKDGVSAPLALLAEQATVGHLVIRRNGMGDLIFDHIEAKGTEWRGVRIWVDRLAFDSPWGAFSLHGYLASRTGTLIDLQTHFIPAPKLIASPMELTGYLGGTLGHPQLSQRISGAASGQVKGDINWAPGPLHWQAVADIKPFSMRQIRPGWRPLLVGGHLEGSGDFHRNKLSSDLLLSDRTLGRWSGRVSLTQEGGLVEIANAELRGRGHAARIDGHGKLRLVSAPDYLADTDIDLAWSNVVWPVAVRNEKAKVRSDNGKAHVSGSLHAYRLTTELGLAAPRYPFSRWQVTGEGDLRHFRGTSVQLQGLNGTASGEASITWLPHLEWHAHLIGKGIEPGRHWPQWPGRLDVDIRSDGNWQSRPIFNVSVQSLRGSLRGYPLAGKGRVDYEGGQWRLAALQIASGSANFSAAGSLIAPWDLTWRLDAPQLGHLLPQARGRVKASGTIRGSGTLPRITLDATAVEAVWRELQLRSALLKADIDLAAQSPWQLSMRANDVRWAEKTLLSFVELQGKGRATDHRIDLQVERPDGHLALKAEGDYHGGEWRGVLHGGEWSGRDGQTLKQEAPAQFALALNYQRLTQFCWKGDEALGCIDYQPVPAGGGVLNASLSALPVQLLAQWLPRRDVQFGGKIFAESHARFDGGLREADLNAHMEGGTMHYRHPLGGTIDLQFKKFAVQMSSREGNSQGIAELDLANGDMMHLEGHLPGWSVGMPLLGSQPVDGTAVLSMRDLSWMTLVIPEILNPTGVISARLALGGTAGDPRLTGTLALNDGAVSIPRAGLTLHKLALAASSPDGKSLRLSGAATSGPGWVTIEGSVRGESLEKWHTEFQLHGDRFEAVRLPSVHLLASPEIHAVIEPYRLDVEGTLRVPEADIKLPELPTTVRQSSDVVLVRGKEKVKEETPWKLNSRLTLQLGDYVRFEGYGFKGRVDGQLTITEKPEMLATGQGELMVHEGSYKAYGQDLTIDYGRLLFANSPIDNPALDVRASRSVEEVKVGVNVTGRLQRPELRLFSEPAMEESDALAYLVLGHPLRTASSSEATSVTAAATSLGLVGGEQIAKAIGNEFGVDEVSVGSVYQNKEAALLLGKYLSPRLYLQYAVVFSDALNVTRLRYELTNHWYIKLESGEQQSADILYTFER